MPPAAEQDAPERKQRQGGGEPNEVGRFVAALTPEDRVLVRLKAEIYEGSWDELVADLEARLQGRPYVLKLASRIEDDLLRIGKLRKFEQEHRINLEEYC